jgi:PilZ domain
MAERADGARNYPDGGGTDSGGTHRDGPEQNRRRSARFSCSGDAKITLLPSDGLFLPGKILDLSLHGCRVDTNLRFDCGVRAEIVLRVNDAAFRAIGEVKELREGAGAGIEFVQLSSSGKDTLMDLIKELAKLQAAMNRLTSARREIDRGSFRRQLAEGKFQAERLSSRFAAVTKAMSNENEDSREDFQPELASPQERIGDEHPLVIDVDVFG